MAVSARSRDRLGVLALAIAAAALAAWSAGPAPADNPPPESSPGLYGAAAADPVWPAAADPEYRNVAYGYRLTYPEGWQALDLMGALGNGLDTSPDVLFYPSEALRWENVDMGVRICQATGQRRTDCLPAHSTVVSQEVTRVAGRKAFRYDLRRAPPREEPWHERHVLVQHGPHTVQIWASWPPRDPWMQRVPTLFQQLLEQFRFTP